MARTNYAITNFAAGIFDSLMSGRVDYDPYRASASVLDNFLCLSQGPIKRRPPLRHVDECSTTTALGSVLMAFNFSREQSYLIEMGNGVARFFSEDALLALPTVTAQITNGTFGSATGWTDVSIAGGASRAYISGGNLYLSCASGKRAVAGQKFVYSGSDTDFTGSIVVTTAPVTVKITDVGTGSVLREQTFTTSGTHTITAISASVSEIDIELYTETTGESVIASVTLSDGDGNIIPNSSFTNATAWLDRSVQGIAGTATVEGGRLYVRSTGGLEAAGQQQVTINQQGVRHVLKLEVLSGSVGIRIGSASGLADVLDYTDIGRGIHQLEFTPASSSVYLQFYILQRGEAVVDNVSIMGAGTYTLPIPYLAADLDRLHWDQDGNRIWIVGDGYVPRVLERRSHYSWSIIEFEPSNGPFASYGDRSISLTPSDSAGVITVTSSKNFFTTDMDRALIELAQPGQEIFEVFAAEGSYSQPIKVTGLKSGREFQVAITGSFAATVLLQMSIGTENEYTYAGTSWTAPATAYLNDSQASVTGSGSNALYTVHKNTNMENLTVYYRLAIPPGNYTTGSVSLRLAYKGGSQTGSVRITGITSPTQASAIVTKPCVAAQATDVWRRSAWSAEQGYPNTTGFGYGRLWLARKRDLWSSSSDDYFDFTDRVDLADSSIVLSITSQTADGIQWIAYLDYLLIGTKSEEFVLFSNNPTEAVSPTTAEIRLQSEEGSSSVQPSTAAGSVIYAHRSGKKVYQLTHTPGALSQESFSSIDLSRLANPTIAHAGVRSLVIQGEPERRIYCVLEDGKIITQLFRREEQITAWSSISTDGIFESVAVVRERDEDVVYVVVRRKIGSTWRRFIERFGREFPDNWEDNFALDAALTLDLERPQAYIIPSATTGTITITADSAAFVAGDVGKIVRVNDGVAVISAYTSTTAVTATVRLPLSGVGIAPPGRWGKGTEVNAISGLDHLEGRQVRMRGGGYDMGVATVTSGSVTLPEAALPVQVGLPMQSTFVSNKIAVGSQIGSSLGQRKSLHKITAILHESAAPILIGYNGRPLQEAQLTSQDFLLGSASSRFSGEVLVQLESSYETDPRLRAEISGSNPATIIGFVCHVQEHDRA